MIDDMDIYYIKVSGIASGNKLIKISVHGIGREKDKSTDKKTPSDNEENRSSSKKFNCFNCGTRHGARECPAYGKTCNYCRRRDHFQSISRSRKKSMDWV